MFFEFIEQNKDIRKTKTLVKYAFMHCTHSPIMWWNSHITA